ncbi:MAG TPA: hypothetical protein VK147_12070 [Candidatus Didemnitutus sp.]|nr:hypothetical protein [Candidatus Didemnitutus sp.]
MHRIALLLAFGILLAVQPILATDEHEHLLIGNAAFISVVTNDDQVRTLLASNDVSEIIGIVDGMGGSDVLLTYGLVSQVLSSPNVDALALLRALQTAVLAQQRGGRIYVDVATLVLLRSTTPSHVHARDLHHHVTPAATYESQLYAITPLLAQQFLPTLRDRSEQQLTFSSNTDTLDWTLPDSLPRGLTAPAMYALFHARSRALLLHAMRLGVRTQRTQFVRLAVITSAIADHFLIDLFASDHHIADCQHAATSSLHATATNTSLEQQGCEEFYRTVGISFRFVNASGSNILFGNGSFDTSQIARTQRAVAASLADVVTLLVPYHDFVDEFQRIVASQPMFPDSYARALLYAPQPLVSERYENARTLARSVRGPYIEVGGNVLTVGRTVGYCIDASAGIAYNLSSFGLPRSRAAGYETVTAFVPCVMATYGFAREKWFALLRAGLAIQFFDALKIGLSAGPSFTAASTSDSRIPVPVFIDANFLSKPLSYHVGLEFLLSVAVTQNAPYDLRLGASFVFY